MKGETDNVFSTLRLTTQLTLFICCQRCSQSNEEKPTGEESECQLASIYHADKGSTVVVPLPIFTKAVDSKEYLRYNALLPIIQLNMGVLLRILLLTNLIMKMLDVD